MIKKIQSVQHPLVKHLVKLRQNADYRYDHKSVVIEGIKMIKESVGHIPFKTLLVADETLIPEGACANELIEVSEAVLEKVSGLKAPEGIIAEVEMPKPAVLKGMKRVIALDGINDPGNLGTLLRTALALGWEGGFIVDESCDPFNEKALRAARGATFRLPIGRGNWCDLKKIAAENHLEPLAADLKGEDVREIAIPEAILLVLGNEARGVSEAAELFCKKITVPISQQMESLNVAIAGSILMFALLRL